MQLNSLCGKELLVQAPDLSTLNEWAESIEKVISESAKKVRFTITLYPIGRPVRATITLYPIGRPVRVFIISFNIYALEGIHNRLDITRV